MSSNKSYNSLNVLKMQIGQVLRLPASSHLNNTIQVDSRVPINQSACTWVINSTLRWKYFIYTLILDCFLVKYIGYTK